MDVAYVEFGLGNQHFALVDVHDLRVLVSRVWRITRRSHTDYAVTSYRVNGRLATVYMHHFLLDPPQGKEVHHINGDGLDNRRSNLVICTHAENMQAQVKHIKTTHSRYKGVTWVKDKAKWSGRITRSDGRRIFLGYFDSEVDGARAYDRAAQAMFGDFARLNFAPVPSEPATSTIKP